MLLQLKTAFRKLEAQSKCYSKVIMLEFYFQHWCCFFFKILSFLKYGNVQDAVVLGKGKPDTSTLFMKYELGSPF